MKKYLLFLVFIFVFSKAQNQRFTYEYKFVSDSTKKENIEKEFMVLDVNPKGSKFYSYEKFKADSLVTIELERQNNSNSEIVSIKNYYKGKIHYCGPAHSIKEVDDIFIKQFIAGLSQGPIT